MAKCGFCGHDGHAPNECSGESEWAYPTVIDGKDVSGEYAGPCVCDCK